MLKGELLSALLFAQMANLRRVVAELRDTPCIDSAADEETEEESFDEIAPDVKEVAEYEEPAGNFEAEPVEDVHEDAPLQEGASWSQLTRHLVRAPHLHAVHRCGYTSVN